MHIYIPESFSLQEKRRDWIEKNYSALFILENNATKFIKDKSGTAKRRRECYNHCRKELFMKGFHNFSRNIKSLRSWRNIADLGDKTGQRSGWDSIPATSAANYCRTSTQTLRNANCVQCEDHDEVRFSKKMTFTRLKSKKLMFLIQCCTKNQNTSYSMQCTPLEYGCFLCWG